MRPIFIFNSTVHFSLHLMRSSLSNTVVTMEQLITPDGVLIPLNAESANILDYLNGEKALGQITSRALLLQHDGKLHEYDYFTLGADTPGTLKRTRLFYGPGVIYARALMGEDERALEALMRIRSPIEVEWVLEKFTGLMHCVPSGYVSYTVEELLAMLLEKYPKPAK